MTALMRQHLPRYALGGFYLATYQGLAYLFDRGLWAGTDAMFAGGGRRVLVLGTGIVVLAVVAMGVRVLSRITIFNAGRDVEYDLRRDLLARLHLLGPAFYRRMPTGEIMSRTVNDLTQVRLALGFGVLNSLNTVFALASSLTIVLSISAKLTLAALVTLPVLVYVMRRFAKATYALTRGYQGALGQMSDRVQASLAGVRVVKSFALEERELAGFDEVNATYLDRTLALAKLRGSMQPIAQALSATGLVIVFIYGGDLVLRGEISPGGFVAFFWALQRLTWPLVALGLIVGIIQRGRAGYTRLREIFDATPDVVDGPLAPPAQLRGSIDVRGLSFSYRPGGRGALDGVSFSIPARGSMALVGRTGSGKSTLAALLARLLPTPPGTVFLDGIDVCDLPLSTVRQAVGYAQQDAFLFSTTVARNVGFALDHPDTAESFEQVRAATAEAQLLDDVLRLPDGFDTVVGERGVQLSGGQKQRVALARALVWEPRVLLLDDPISAVDARTESAILDTISEEAEKRTVLLITHRVAAAARCDQIAVLDEGRIVEQGTHAELIRHGGLYARFAEEQRIEGELEALAHEGEEPAAGAPVSAEISGALGAS
jgi:ATP-binding cassette subfamily B protein